MQILHLPLRAIRIVTDPIVDTVLLVVSRLLVTPLAVLTQLALTWALGVLSSFAGPERAEKLADVVTTVVSIFLISCTGSTCLMVSAVSQCHGRRYEGHG